MHLDVVDLRRFYYRTPLGRAAQRSLQEAIRGLWPRVAGETVVGFGFAAPFLRPLMGEAARTLCLMPAQQGVCRWPPEGPNVSVLTDETHWPLPAGVAVWRRPPRRLGTLICLPDGFAKVAVSFKRSLLIH